MLAGFSDQLDIQIGYNDGETVTIAIAGAYSSQLGIADGFGSAQAIGVLDQNDLTVSDSETVVDLSSYENSHEKIGHVLNHDNWFGSSWGYGTPDSTYQSQNAFIHFEDGSSFEVVTFFPDTGNANAAPTLKINTTLAELAEKNGQKWDVTGGGVSAIDLVSSPSSALTDIDIAIDQINTLKVELGATQNRLAYVVSNLMNVAENTSAARSRIQDTDFAIETAGLAKTLVLRHTATAMLAHANAQPQIVLSLIR